MESGASSPSAASTFDADAEDAYSVASTAAEEGDKSNKKKKSALSSAQAVVHWWQSMRLQFGDGLLLQIFFVYFTQGIRSTLCSLGTSYYLNETLALAPAQSESLRATAAIPWIIKPLYGMLSDSVPIWGRGASPTCSSSAPSRPPPTSRSPRPDSSRPTRARSWRSWSRVSASPSATSSSTEKWWRRREASARTWLATCRRCRGSPLGRLRAGLDGVRVRPQHIRPAGRLLPLGSGPLCVVLISTKIPEETYVPQGDLGFFQTVQDQCRALATVVVDPICWRPMLWIFLSNALPPSVGEAMFSFKTAELGFSKSFLGFISTVGSFTLLGTTALYNAYFRDMPFRRMFFRIQLASACVSFAEFVLVSRLNVAFGIGDRFFIFGDEILSDVVARLKHMPSLVLCAKICPPGIEGTMFALLMSIYNFSWSVASYGGSWLCSYLQISKTNFAGLAVAVTIRSVAKLVPLFLLFMVPATTSISSSSLASKSKAKATRKQSESGSDSDGAAIDLKVQA